MAIPDAVAAGEHIGRGVFSTKHARRAARSRAPLNIFLERPGEVRLSVDRLDVVPRERAIAIANRVGTLRGRTFHGWAVVLTREARLNGRQVEASPLPDNPGHADIVLPNEATDDREEQKRHAQELADAARWRPAREENE